MRLFFFVLDKRVRDFKDSIKILSIRILFKYSIIYLNFKSMFDKKEIYLHGLNGFKTGQSILRLMNWVISG